MKEILESYSIDCTNFASAVTDINSMSVDTLADVAYDYGIISVPESEIKTMIKFVAQTVISGEQSESVVRVTAWKKLAEWRKKNGAVCDVDAALLEAEAEQEQTEHENMLDSNKNPDNIIHTNQQEDANMARKTKRNNVETVETVETVVLAAPEAVEAELAAPEAVEAETTTPEAVEVMVEAVEAELAAPEAAEIQLTASEAVTETVAFAPKRGRGRPKLAETAYDRAVKIFQNHHGSRANAISAAIAAGIPKASANVYASKYWQTLTAAA